MTTRDSHLSQRLAISFAASLLIHAGLMVGLSRLMDHLERPALPVRAPVTQVVPVLSEEQVARLLKKLPPPPNQPLAAKIVVPPEPKKPPERPPFQVVEITPPKEERVPEDAELSSEYNSDVDKQTVSANRESPSPKMRKSERVVLSPGDDEDGTLNAPKRPKPVKQPQQNPQPNPGDANREDPRPPAKQPGESVTVERPLTKPNPLPEGNGQFAAAPEGAESKPRQAGGGAKLGGGPAPDDYRALLPTLGPQDLARKDGSIDYLPEIEIGEGTFLDTVEYKYAWFFNRVKSAVEQHWRPAEAHRRHDPFGRVFGVRDRVTVLEVTLSTDGHLEKVIVAENSGAAHLDEAAVQAFKAAQPFPNPPVGLKDEDGRIRFRFAFHLEVFGRGMRFGRP